MDYYLKIYDYDTVMRFELKVRRLARINNDVSRPTSGSVYEGRISQIKFYSFVRKLLDFEIDKIIATYKFF